MKIQHKFLCTKIEISINKKFIYINFEYLTFLKYKFFIYFLIKFQYICFKLINFKFLFNDKNLLLLLNIFVIFYIYRKIYYIKFLNEI